MRSYEESPGAGEGWAQAKSLFFLIITSIEFNNESSNYN